MIKQTQPLNQNRSLQRRNLPKPSITSQAVDRTENAGTISQLPHHFAMATIKPQTGRFT